MKIQDATGRAPLAFFSRSGAPKKSPKIDKKSEKYGKIAKSVQWTVMVFGDKIAVFLDFCKNYATVAPT